MSLVQIMLSTSPLLSVAQVRAGDKGWPVTDLIVTNPGKDSVFDISCKGILWNDFANDYPTGIQNADVKLRAQPMPEIIGSSHSAKYTLGRPRQVRRSLACPGKPGGELVGKTIGTICRTDHRPTMKPTRG